MFYRDFEAGADRQWRVQVLEAASDGTDRSDATPPTPQSRLAVAPVRLVYHGGDEPGPPDQVRLSVVDSSGVEYQSDAIACAGAGLEPIDPGQPLPINGSIEGHLCWWVPADRLDTLTLIVRAEPAEGAVYLALG